MRYIPVCTSSSTNNVPYRRHNDCAVSRVILSTSRGRLTIRPFMYADRRASTSRASEATGRLESRPGMIPHSDSDARECGTCEGSHAERFCATPTEPNAFKPTPDLLRLSSCRGENTKGNLMRATRCRSQANRHVKTWHMRSAFRRIWALYIQRNRFNLFKPYHTHVHTIPLRVFPPIVTLLTEGVGS